MPDADDDLQFQMILHPEEADSERPRPPRTGRDEMNLAEFPFALLAVYSMDKAAFELLAFARFALVGKAGLFLGAKLGALAKLPRILAQRKQIQRGRRLSAIELLARMQRDWLRSRMSYERKREIAR